MTTPDITYAVAEQEPGRRLVLAGRRRWRAIGRILLLGGTDRLFRRLFIAGMLGTATVSFLVAPIVAIAVALAGGDTSVLKIVPALPCFWALPLACIGWVLWSAGWYRRLAFDAEAGVTLGHTGRAIFDRSVSFGPGELGKLKVEIGPEPMPGLPVEVSLQVGEASVGPFAVEQVDRRAEALDLAFRLARLGGFDGFLRVHDDPQRIALEMTRGGQGEPLPAASGPIDWSEQGALDRFREPDSPVDPFDPRLLPDRYTRREWRPGELVSIATPAIGPLALAARAAIGAAVFAGLTYLVMDWTVALTVGLGSGSTVSLGELGVLWQVGLAALLGAAASALFARVRHVRREASLDWTRRRARFVRGRRTRRVGFDRIEGVLLRRVVRVTTTSVERGAGALSGGGYRREARDVTLYACVLELVLPGPDEEVLRTAESTDPEEPYRNGLPALVALARALDAPWRWQSHGAG